MPWEFVTWGIREDGAMTAIMFMNLHTVLRGLIDALVSSWMRQAAAEAEQGRPSAPSR
jgi:hypothetical protein